MEAVARGSAPADFSRLEPPAELVASGAPEVATTEVGACIVCGEGRPAPVAAGFDYELLTCANPWQFVRCRSCGHVWLDPRPADEALEVIYPATYYAYRYEEEVGPVARRGKELLDRLKFRGILKQLARPPRAYVDIGCGSGRFLRLMDGKGVSRTANHGIELDADALRPLEEAGYRTFCGRVEECEEIASESIELATMFHVIEHVSDPAAVVERVSEWLAPGGVFAVETPNIDSLDRRLFEDGFWGGYHIPRHWHLFSERTLGRLLEQSELEVESVAYQTGHAFWMYSLHHRLRYGRRPRPRLARIFDPFASLPPLVAFTVFDKLRAALGAKTSAMLVLARKPR